MTNFKKITVSKSQLSKNGDLKLYSNSKTYWINMDSIEYMYIPDDTKTLTIIFKDYAAMLLYFNNEIDAQHMLEYLVN